MERSPHLVGAAGADESSVDDLPMTRIIPGASKARLGNKVAATVPSARRLRRGGSSADGAKRLASAVGARDSLSQIAAAVQLIEEDSTGVQNLIDASSLPATRPSLASIPDQKVAPPTEEETMPDASQDDSPTAWSHTQVPAAPSTLTSSDTAQSHSGSHSALAVLTRSGKLRTIDERTNFVKQWLQENFEVHAETSLPRHIVFQQYQAACEKDGHELVMPATFGKVIRSVFPNLKTRRLGTRGHSKYHYFGIGPKGIGTNSVAAASLLLACGPNAKRKIYAHAKNTCLPTAGNNANTNSNVNANGSYTTCSNTASNAGFGTLPSKRTSGPRPTISGESVAATVTGSAPTPTASANVAYIPLVPDFDEFSRFVHQICAPMPGKIPRTIHPDAMSAFSVLYQGHVIKLLRLISARDFGAVEVALGVFWSSLRKDLWTCLTCEEGIRIVNIADDYLFQVALHILVPEVLEPLPLPVTQAIRQFARSLETWMMRAFESAVPLPIVEAKIDVTRRFCQALRRRTSLNHLAQAVRAVLASPEHLALMLQDFNAIDFGALREQVQWVIPGYETFLSYMEDSFRSLLFEAAPITGWTDWLGSVVEQTLVSLVATELEDASRELMLRWSFFTSTIMRDLTLRSAGSFGSYHLMRLLFDEYIMYFLEKKMDEKRRALGLLSFWPAQQDQAVYETALAGFASMDDLFRKSGLLAYSQNGPTSTVHAGTGNSDPAPMMAEERI